eukprot:SAG31_NODE_5751_length_2345_cov_1.588157_3_plen_320_part_01
MQRTNRESITSCIQWRKPPIYDHSAWCHATSPDMASEWTTHQPALMAGPWPGGHGVGGTGNVLPALTTEEAARLNASHAILTGGAFVWLSSDPQLMHFQAAGSLGLDPAPRPGVRYCGDVHIFRHGAKWRILAAGSDGTCMDAANASITPLGVLYESDSLVIGKPDSWRFVSVLYTGAPGDGPRMECPTYFPAASAGGVSVLLFSKTGTNGACPPGTPNACPPPAESGAATPGALATTDGTVPCVGPAGGCCKCWTNGVYWATGIERADSTLEIQHRGRQQVGGYANEGFHDAQNNRHIVYSWLGGGLHGTVNCTNHAGI